MATKRRGGVECSTCGGTGRVSTGMEARQLRKAAGLSLREVARRMELSAAYVCDLEHGYRALNHSLWERYVKAVS